MTMPHWRVIHKFVLCCQRSKRTGIFVEYDYINRHHGFQWTPLPLVSYNTTLRKSAQIYAYNQSSVFYIASSCNILGVNWSLGSTHIGMVLQTSWYSTAFLFIEILAFKKALLKYIKDQGIRLENRRFEAYL